jgi:hypothetical protein
VDTATFSPGQAITDSGAMKDWLWMRERTSAHISGNMPVTW